MPYNPGITAHGGQLLAAGLGQGLQQLADSHKRVGEILAQKEERAKADRQMAKAFGTIINADQTMQKILSDRLGLNPKDFGDLAIRDQLAIGEGMMKLPGIAEAFANAGIRQNQQGLTRKQLEAFDRTNAIDDALKLTQLAGGEIRNIQDAAGIPFADAMAQDAADMSTAGVLNAQTGALLEQKNLKNFDKNIELEESKIKVNQLNADTLARKQAMNEASAAVKLGKAKWSPAQFIKLSPDQLKNRLVDIYDEFGPEEFAVAMRAATEALALNEQMRDKSAGKSAPVSDSNGFAPPKTQGQRVRKFDPKSGKLID
jgi:hypothetical protein